MDGLASVMRHHSKLDLRSVESYLLLSCPALYQPRDNHALPRSWLYYCLSVLVGFCQVLQQYDLVRDAPRTTPASPTRQHTCAHVTRSESRADPDVTFFTAVCCRTAVRQQLQALSATPVHPIPRCSSSSSSECSKVVSPSSSLPHRPPSIIERRSVISAQLLQCGPWVLLDDGCSLVSLNEAVMLSHVMRFGPYGTGMTVQLVL